MGIQKKAEQHGKGRLDKWYKLAKEKGYRARAAFKLIQLNRKYGFLEKSKVLLDLCAAPGSWCQVAAETMPASSLIVGVDLAPIKPIPRTITFQSDIASDKCRATIKQHFKSWKADTVLHDGAPNVGTAWVQDAFSQAELVLQALKLATEFLVEGGTFVTKVFRSKDYNALLWVFNQLFAKVEATKPPSSRSVSAEIFVVCRDFRAPKRIDPRFLDPRHVFAELSNPTPNLEAKVFNPEKKKRKRDGYEDGDYTQFKEISAIAFIRTADPIAMLGSLNRLTFNQQEDGDIATAALERLPETSTEIIKCCLDLKVLGRKEFRALLRWRSKARAKFGFSLKNETTSKAGDEVAEVSSMTEDLQIQQELQSLHSKEKSRKKREKRRENERKHKEIIRMQMHMMPPTDIGLEQTGPIGEDSMFTLVALERASSIRKAVECITQVPAKETTRSGDESNQYSESDEGDDLDRELDTLYNEYQERRSESDAKYRVKKARKEHKDNDWDGFSERGESSEGEHQLDIASEISSDEDENCDLSIIPKSSDNALDNQDTLTARASQFFEQDIFNDIGYVEPEIRNHSSRDTSVSKSCSPKSLADDKNIEIASQVGSKRTRNTNSDLTFKVIQPSASLSLKRPESPKDDLHRRERVIPDNENDSVNSFELVPDEKGVDWDKHNALRGDGRSDIDIITAEAMTLAQQVASKQKSIHDLMDDGFNKYSFLDQDGLPEWFLDDEGKHSKPLRPITAAGAAAIKEKLRALNARPIKKVREAKDRKKYKAAQALEKLRKKSALVADEEGISEKDKAQSIGRLINKATKKKPRQKVKVVVAKGGNRGISGRPGGVKGRYKIVDARLKKDVRAEKRLAKKRR